MINDSSYAMGIMAAEAETMTFLKALIRSNTKYGEKNTRIISDLFSLKSGKNPFEVHCAFSKQVKVYAYLTR